MRWKHLFSVAPMMEYTDIHQRYLMRLLSKHAVLYTEMVTANTICRASPDILARSLAANFNIEDLVVLQLGGSDIIQMRAAARIARDYGYKEINLNVGCPSEKVAGKGCFGAALMLDPHLVAALCHSISDETNLPTTVKCRIGVNDFDSYEHLCNFISTVAIGGGVNHFIVHARKAILNANFSPDDNRKIPPLKYDYVYNLIRDFPHLKFTINGGINTYEDISTHISNGVHGVMVGRAVVNTPYYWRHIDAKIYGEEKDSSSSDNSRSSIMHAYAEYARQVEIVQGERARTAVMKPILGVFAGVPNGKVFRRRIDEGMRNKKLLVGDNIVQAMESTIDASVLNDSLQ